MADPLYGRHRESLADIEDRLFELFEGHPDAYTNPQDEPTIPGLAVLDVLHEFSEQYGANRLMSESEEDSFKQLLETNPGIEVTPQILLAFIAMRTQESPPAEEDDRGRGDERDSDHSRSSSRSSAIYRGSNPTTPASPFDASKRQRSQPLEKAAPSSWSRRPMPPTRRKSDAGNGGHSRSASDSENTSPSTSRAGGRSSRRGSVGQAPPMTSSTSEPYAPSSYNGSRPPSRQHSRPHSRSHSQQPQIPFMPMGYPERSHSPEDEQYEQYPRGGEDSFAAAVSSVAMPHDDDQSDEDETMDHRLGLIADPMMRSAASSMISMDEQERIEALQRVNDELRRKIQEAERTLMNRLAEHESELEEMQSRLEEAKSELSATKREEKELRSKERQNSTQIQMLEGEIAKLQKSLENARASYQSLQKQYQEQCVESERYRNTLRRRDEELKDYQDAAQLQQLETQKVARERTGYEDRIAQLEDDLNLAQQAHAQLDEQKQENLMLKETIDRMRYDMDELRNTQHAGSTGTGSGNVSRQSSVSKSLGAELLQKMGRWEMMGGEDEEEEEDEQTAVEAEEDDDDTEGEDVVQTIITRTKRRVASKAKTPTIERIHVEEVKEYANMSVQYDPYDHFASSSSQTDPEPRILRSTLSTQTEDRPLATFAAQTEPEPKPAPRSMASMEIQTDEVEEEPLASSSSTISPPTPRPSDLPPAYNDHERELVVATETLKNWHPGISLPIQTVSGGISAEAAEEWKALKEELGVGCRVLDQIVAATPKTASRSSTSKRGRNSSRFYNIYNTYVYRSGDDGEGGILPSGTVLQVLLCAGASAAVFLAMSHSLAPQYSVPGGPTYYDRVAWSSFNSMHAGGEGFGADGTAAVWNLFGRLGGGAAARIARGYPT